jgi:NADP-dependent 3-hydroxy acid dehydrogenase YdfG
MQRTAVVTGASRGIGLAASRALADAGFRVLMVARGSEALHSAASELGGIAVQGDVGAAAGTLIDALRAHVPEAPDVLVNNAGVFELQSLALLEPAELVRNFETNLFGPFRLIRAFLPAMIARGSGDIISIGSIADRATFPENAAYAGSKHALRIIHETLRMETRGSGVRATLVSPAPVDTPIWDAVDPDNRPGFTPRASMLPASAVGDAVAWVATRPPGVNVDELRISRS